MISSGFFIKPYISGCLSEYVLGNGLEPDKIGTLLYRTEDVETALAKNHNYEEITIVQANQLAVESYSKNTSKGAALKWLVEYLNISQEEVAAIEDSNSDVSMLSYAGISVAMENGTDYAKENADTFRLMPFYFFKSSPAFSITSFSS